MLHQQTQEEANEKSLLHTAGRLPAVAPQSPPLQDAYQEFDGEAETDTQATGGNPISAATSELETREQSLQIKRLRLKLSRHSFLPQQDAYWENPGPLSPYKFAAVIGGLCSPAPPLWRERMLCAWLLGHSPLTPPQQAEAARELGRVARNRHVSQSEQLRGHLQASTLRTLPVAALGAVAITIQMMSATITNKLVADDTLFIFTSAIAFVALLIPVFTVLFGLGGLLNIHRANRVRMAAVLALGRLRSPEAVGALARATLDVSPGIRSVAEESLRQCLPQITPDHYARLDADTVPALCRLLNVKKERLFANHAHTEQLVLDALAALGKIGDGSAVRPVESVAEDGWTQPVRAAARQILPVLQERQRQENNPRLLLRGSAPPPTPGDQLLRPTSTTLIALPEQLLRPSVAPKTENKGK